MELRLHRSQTKVIATIGPACSSEEKLREMIYAGIDVFRLNMSHGSHEDHLVVIERINKLNQELNTNVAILADLQGPKLRVGVIADGAVDLEEGSELRFVTYECEGNAQEVYMSYQEFPRDVKKGDAILIDDGKLKLEALDSNGKDEVVAKVIHGGPLSSKKGVNLPNTNISQPSMTEKDVADAIFAMEHNVDWVALSFVRRATDIIDLKDLMKAHKKNIAVIAKIEKPEALEEINGIVDIADGIMIARGDLGVEVPFDEVPIIQKQLIQAAILRSKPVIVATQMMESMVTNFRPTRAEANDVANAVLDGADTVMLSGETSVGAYPVQAIQSMQRIIDQTEGKGFGTVYENIPQNITHKFIPDSICYTATTLAKNAKSRAIIIFTHSGYTAFRVSSHRPDAKIYVFATNEKIIRRLSLLWGVRAFYFDKDAGIEDTLEFSIQYLKDMSLLDDNDTVVHLDSSPHLAKGLPIALKLSYV